MRRGKEIGGLTFRLRAGNAPITWSTACGFEMFYEEHDGVGSSRSIPVMLEKENNGAAGSGVSHWLHRMASPVEWIIDKAANGVRI